MLKKSMPCRGGLHVVREGILEEADLRLISNLHPAIKSQQYNKSEEVLPLLPP